LTRIDDVLVVKYNTFKPSFSRGLSIAFRLGKPSSSTEAIIALLLLVTIDNPALMKSLGI
jgi:hypothetical protein